MSNIDWDTQDKEEGADGMFAKVADVHKAQMDVISNALWTKEKVDEVEYEQVRDEKAHDHALDNSF